MIEGSPYHGTLVDFFGAVTFSELFRASLLSVIPFKGSVEVECLQGWVLEHLEKLLAARTPSLPPTTSPSYKLAIWGPRTRPYRSD